MKTTARQMTVGRVFIPAFLILSAGCATSTASKLPTTGDGLVALTSAELKETFNGKSFVEASSGGWTWDFQSDGLAQAKALNGDWETKDQKWSIEGDKLCRSLNEEYPCVEIYKVDDTILFGKADSDSLETWAIKAK